MLREWLYEINEFLHLLRAFEMIRQLHETFYDDEMGNSQSKRYALLQSISPSNQRIMNYPAESMMICTIFKHLKPQFYFKKITNLTIYCSDPVYQNSKESTEC